MTSLNKSSLIPFDAIPVGPPNSYLDFESLTALQAYIEGLRRLRKGPKLIMRHRLRQPISLPNVAAQRATGDGRIPSRPPPRFHQSGDDAQGLFVGDLVFRKAVQRPPIGDIHVWIADVVALGDKKGIPLGSVVLRILQQSLMHLPDPADAEDIATGLRVSSLSPLEDLAQEYHMYEDMKELQGSVLPYCLGLHEIMMRNGEMACALILEHVEGETLGHWIDNNTTNGPLPPVDQAWLDQLSDDEVKQHNAVVFAEQERIGPHSNQIFEPPNVKWTQYLADAKQLIPMLFDTLDTLSNRGILLELRKEDLIITKDHDKPKSVVVMQFREFTDLSKLNPQAAWKTQVSLFLSLVVDCCDKHRAHLLPWAEEERIGFRQSLTWGNQSVPASTGT